MKIYYGGPIITMEEENMLPQSVVTEGEKIVFAGALDRAEREYPSAQPCCLSGHTLMPGFTDTHCHLSFAGESRIFPDVFNVSSNRELIERIKKRAPDMSEGEVLIANGYNGVPIEEGRNISLREMDEALPDHPLFLRSAGTHCTFVNSMALELMRAEAKKEGFTLDERDEREGCLRNRANLLSSGIGVRLMSARQRQKSMEFIIRECSKYGITAVHSMEGRLRRDDPDVISLIEHRAELPFDLRIYYQTTDVDEVLSRGLKAIGGCFNCILDGDLEPGTAALREPYLNNPSNKGVLYFSDEELTDFFIRANRAGLQICMHAIGDAAIEQALNAYEKALEDCPRPEHRHRIEHFDIAAPDLIERARALGICLSMQPAFDYYWPRDDYAFFIGQDRACWKCPLRAAVDAGIPVASGSDWPVTPVNPFIGIHGAVNHSVPSSRLSVIEALKLYTISAAYLGFAEKERGSIKAGKEASMIILSENPLECAEAALDKIQVLETVYKGRTVWKKEESE